MDKAEFLRLFCQHVPAETSAQKGKPQAGLGAFEDVFAGLIKATESLCDARHEMLFLGLCKAESKRPNCAFSIWHLRHWREVGTAQASATVQ